VEKREKEEWKKLEKTFKKDQQDVEDIWHDQSINPAKKAQMLKDRIQKTIGEINKN
jgi:hypothetical protein